MSRLKRFAHSLISGYVLLGANMIYTLASVPLALKYLSKAEFGLWALATQVAGYVALVDFGLSASASRVLIDHKDRRASGDYGSIVQTGALVGFTQGTLVILVGLVVALFIGPVLKVDVALQHDFKWLMIGQCVLIGVGFYTRILNHMLTAHQRYDISNYTSAILFALSFAVMWWCFEHGFGVYSTLWGLASGTFIVIAVNIWACARLGFIPGHGEWGRPSWVAFKELFVFARDFFVFAVGAQLINASQLILLTRFSGLEAATTWSVCTRTFLVLSQLVFRIFDYSSAAFAEMMVRGERVLLQKRFREIVALSVSLSVAAAVMLALCNSAFVSVWTSGRINSLKVFPVDFKEPAQLVIKLRGGADVFSQSLWKTFPAEIQGQLLPPVTGDEKKKALTDEEKDRLKTMLAAEFNRIFQNESLFAQERFDKGRLSEETLSLAGAPTASTDKFQLNRYLVEDCFPEEFASSRKSHWSPWNDLLLGVWLVVCVIVHAHTGLVGQTKEFKFLRYLTFIEGVVFIGLNAVLQRFGGMTMMLVLSIVVNLTMELPYGWHRTREYFSISRGEVAGWHRSILGLLVWLVPAAVATWWFTRGQVDFTRLWVVGAVMGVWTTFILLRFGLSPAVHNEILKRAPRWLRPVFVAMGYRLNSPPDH
jgi:O-antigen/teichoic acid export membrane protein